MEATMVNSEPWLGLQTMAMMKVPATKLAGRWGSTKQGMSEKQRSFGQSAALRSLMPDETEEGMPVLIAWVKGTLK